MCLPNCSFCKSGDLNGKKRVDRKLNAELRKNHLPIGFNFFNFRPAHSAKKTACTANTAPLCGCKTLKEQWLG